MKKIIAFILLVTSLYAQYPRVGLFTWGGAPASHYARHDLMIIGNASADFVKQVKALNPDIIILHTVDWNAGGHAGERIPLEYQLKLCNGKNVGLYYSDFVAKDIRQRAVNWTVGSEWFAGFIQNRTNLSVFDGVATDGLFGAEWALWRCPDYIDFDNSGEPDRDEHGRDWIIDTYTDGVKRLKSKMRDMLDDKLMVINSGMWFGDHQSKWTQNGAIIEYYGPSSNYAWEWSTYKDFMGKAREPQMSLFLAQPKSEDRHCPKDSRNYFRFMRFTLCKVLMGNGYYHYEPAKLLNHAEHYYNVWFDEFDLDLGMPIGEPEEIANGVWKREFEKGIVFLNTNRYDISISLNDDPIILYKFRGGQCPDINNGQPVDTLTLQGHSFKDWGGVSQTVGDGIILMRSQTTCVSDIIIDNTADFTSPGQEPLKLDGDWRQIADKDSGYALRVSENHGMYSYAKGTGSYLCMPRIAVPGDYQIFRWNNGWESLGTEQLGNGNYAIGGDSGRADAYLFRYVGTGQVNWDFIYWLSLVLSGI